MKENQVDLIIHPVRLRIIRALWGNRMTIAEIAGQLTDIPQATLYRHINKLSKGGIMTVVAEHPVRGTLEKIYALADEEIVIGPEKLKRFTKEDHLRHFTAFIAVLLSDFSRYLESHEKIDFVRDLVAYKQAPLYLNDKEAEAMSRQLRKTLNPFLANKPGGDRRRLVLSTILMPLNQRINS